MNRKLLALLCALMLFVAPAALAQEPAPRSIVVSEPVHLIGYLPLYVAIHEGYFAEEGLDVTVVQATGGAHVTAVVSGDAFAAIGGVDSYNFANQGNHDPIRAIVNCVNRANVYLFARKGLVPASDSAEDMAAFLKGKVIVAGRYGGSPNVLTRWLVKSVGLDPDTDVTLSENADASTVTAMLQYGQGDIGNGGEPQISEGVTAGIFEEPFVKFPDLGDYAYSVIGVKQSTIEQEPETCMAFISEIMREVRHSVPMYAWLLKNVTKTTSSKPSDCSRIRMFSDAEGNWLMVCTAELGKFSRILSAIFSGLYQPFCSVSTAILSRLFRSRAVSVRMAK